MNFLLCQCYDLYNISSPYIQADGADALKHLRFTSNLEEFHLADFIIEAIVESEDIKKNLFVQLDKIAKSSAILASNTSSISITRLAASTSRPHQVFVWVHFIFSDCSCAYFKDLFLCFRESSAFSI